MSRYCLNPQETLQEVAVKNLSSQLPKKAVIALATIAILAPLTIGIIIYRLISSPTITTCQHYQKFPNYCQLALQMLPDEELEKLWKSQLSIKKSLTAFR